MSDCRILVVDDDVPNLDVVCDVLQDEGYAPVRATTGEQALLLAEQTLPNLILLDWWLPDLPGREVARQLRERGLTSTIVAFTAATFPRDRVLDPNVTDYFAKPFDLVDLVTLVERYCPPKMMGTSA